MHILLNRMKRPFPQLNFQPYTFEDVKRIAEKERINLTICDYDDDVLGYYCTRKTEKQTKKFIVINQKLDEINRTFVGLHELAHHFLHIPASARQWLYCSRNANRIHAKNDCEANSFALIAMIPLWMMIDLDATGYQDIDPVLMKFCIQRKKLWEKFAL